MSLPLRPFLFGFPPHTAEPAARLRSFGLNPLVLDTTEGEQSGVFFRLLLAGNALAFGGLGMPAWVQLDCCALPSVLAGFLGFAGELEAPQLERLCRGAGLPGLSPDQPVPLSAFCALPTLDQGRVMGVSLWSLQPGLGARSKALGWLSLNKTEHMGITQYCNRAVCTHARFGPLTVLKAEVPVHDLGAQTFIYTNAIPAPDRLYAFCTSPLAPPQTPPQDAVLIDLSLPIEQISAGVRQHIQRRGRAQIIAPGHWLHDGKRWLCLAAR